MAPVIGSQACQQRISRGLLLLGINRGVDDITVVIGRVTKALDHFTPDHFGNVVGIHLDDLTIKGSGHRGSLGGITLGFRNHAEVFHSAENPVTPDLAFLRVAEGVVARRCFGYACQHGVLCQIQFCERFAVIGFCRRFKTVGAVPQKYTVNIKLEDFFLAQTCLDLQSEKNLRKFSDECLIQGQEVVSRHLHGDR